MAADGFPRTAATVGRWDVNEGGEDGADVNDNALWSIRCQDASAHTLSRYLRLGLVTLALIDFLHFTSSCAHAPENRRMCDRTSGAGTPVHSSIPELSAFLRVSRLCSLTIERDVAFYSPRGDPDRNPGLRARRPSLTKRRLVRQLDLPRTRPPSLACPPPLPLSHTPRTLR